MSSNPCSEGPPHEGLRPGDEIESRKPVRQPQQTPPSQSISGIESTADARHEKYLAKRPLWRRMLASEVLAILAVALAVISFWLYRSSPRSLTTPSNIAISVESPVPVSLITYSDSPKADNEYAVAILVALSASVGGMPNGADVSLTISWPNGSNVSVTEGDTLHNRTRVIGENVVSHLDMHFLPLATASHEPGLGRGLLGEAFFTVTTQNFGYSLNSVAASVAIPGVAYRGPGAPKLVTYYSIPSFSNYAWSFFPTSSTGKAQWNEVLTNGKAPAQVISGTNATNESRANLATFVNGALVALAGAAFLSAVQELLHINDQQT